MQQTEVSVYIPLPVLFFTLESSDERQGNNPQSQRIILELRKLFSTTPTDNATQPECLVFKTREEIVQHFHANDIVPKCAIALFDDLPRIGNHCIRYIEKGASKRAACLPHWSNAHWAIMVNARLPDKRISGLAAQIKAIFRKNYVEQVTNGGLPWGQAPSSTRNGGHRKKIKTKKAESGQPIHAWQHS
jgi:hypothetical protein